MPDLVVLGATGFTGKLVVECLANCDLSWMITGRTQQKIKDLVDGLRNKGVDVSHVPSQIVDVRNYDSLAKALQNAKLVLNCVGPNTTTSHDIVEGCIRSRTHYIDMSAEINHILDLYVKYHKTAEEANVLIIPSCGFASLVVASGLLYLKKQFKGTLDSAECYFELGIPKRACIPFVGSLASYGTWASLVHVLRNMKEFQRVKREIFPAVELPKEMKRKFFHCRRRKIWYPYPGPDENVIEMSERYLEEKHHKRPVHFKLYSTMPLFIHYLIIPAMYLYFYLSYFNWFAKLLWKFPRLFTLGYMSHEGPSPKMREETKYSFSYIGKGWDESSEDLSKAPSKVVKVKVHSNDPYRTTAVVMIAAAMTLLKEEPQMPSGGVVNVAAAFSETKLVERLERSGIKYEVLPNT